MANDDNQRIPADGQDQTIPAPENTPKPKGVEPKIGPDGDSSGAANPDFSTGVDTGAIQPGKTGGATAQ